ncbi:MAG: pyridoxamine 5'-phosphate oxidase family protein [bacterium]|nr:pyridoxamine 5'-phosphate oxidase family protein [bacterium]
MYDLAPLFFYSRPIFSCKGPSWQPMSEVASHLFQLARQVLCINVKTKRGDKTMAEDSWFYKGEIEAQERWDSKDIWDEARRKRLLWERIPDELIPRIEAVEFFFLATSNNSGECDCSFKGGGPRLIRILDPGRFAFPDFEGNGAFMSIGNIFENPHVGCLFIDFSDGGRLRVNGRASVHDSGKMKDLFPDAPRVIVVEIEQVVPNCSKHIPRLVRKE